MMTSSQSVQQAMEQVDSIRPIHITTTTTRITNPEAVIPTNDHISSDSVQQREEEMEVVYKDSIHNTTATSTIPEAVIPTIDSNNNNDSKSFQDKLSYYIQLETYFFNHGSRIVFLMFWMTMNIKMGAWGALIFTAPTFHTESDILRITLPIARASGRIVSFNSGLILLSACKFFITWIRTNTIIPYGFPMDSIMPEYHRLIAYMIIVMGCFIHTAPQVYNYATKTLIINGNIPIWSFGEGLSTRSLLYTGIILWFTFIMFSTSTLESIRRTTKGFRLFWVLHITGIVIVIPTLLIHGTYMGIPITFYFMILPLTMYLCDFYLRRIYHFKRECKLISIIPHTDEKVTELHIQLSPFPYTPGQYADINIPELAKHEWHPFTIASAPTIDQKADSVVNLTFCIKSSGRWMNALYDIAVKHKEAQQEQIDIDVPVSVSIRGPFGAPAQNYFLYKHIVVIGSGIGVTPLLSIWKYLVNQAKLLMVEEDFDTKENPTFSSSYRGSCDRTETAEEIDEKWEEEHLLNDSNLSYVGIRNFTYLTNSISRKSNTTHSINNDSANTNIQRRVKYAYYASILGSMTVNICFLCFAMTMETIVFSCWMFGKKHPAAIIQGIVSSLAILIFGGKIICSSIAYGKRYYKQSIAFKLETGILTLKKIDVIFAIFGLIEDPLNITITTIYLVIFICYMILHAIRIFQIFYSTARPSRVLAEENEADNNADHNSKSEHKIGGVLSSLRSVKGIWVAQNYSGMSFAAQDLLKDFSTLPDKFSLSLYATRDKQSDLDKIDPFSHGTVDMQGNIDLEAECDVNHKAKTQKQQQQTISNYRLIGGRPDWEKIFMEIINNVHDESPDGGGEAVGVFFCGALAIACALQNAAYRVNAQHKHLTKNQCRCGILIHKENF